MEASVSYQIVSYALYMIAFLLLIYVVAKVREKPKEFSVEAAVGIIGIIVTVLIQINIPKPDHLGNISGAWSGIGTVQTPNGIFNDEMTLTISSDCEEGKICGQAFFPSVSCSLSLEFLGDNNGRYYFDERNTSTGCGIAIETYLEPIGKDKIRYHAMGDWGETNITLERQK